MWTKKGKLTFRITENFKISKMKNNPKNINSRPIFENLVSPFRQAYALDDSNKVLCKTLKILKGKIRKLIKKKTTLF